MSWSMNVIGRPEDLVRELEIQSTRLTGDSKADFDKVAPCLKELIKANVGDRFDGSPLMLHLDADGHAQPIDGVVTQSYLNVSIKRVVGRVLLPTA